MINNIKSNEEMFTPIDVNGNNKGRDESRNEVRNDFVRR